jgi:hypothetical protein
VIRRRLPEILLVIGSICVCLLVGEVAARLFLPTPTRADHSAMVEAREIRKTANRTVFQSLHRPDPEIGWVLTSDAIRLPHRLLDAQGTVQYDVVYSVMAGQRRTSATPAGGPALITAGCSFTFGHGLNDEDTWPWMLQEKLPDYRVINVGSMGYGTDQALLAAEREVRRHPGKTAAVVLGFGDFQIERNRCTQGWLATVYPFSKPLFAIRSGEAEYQRQARFWFGGVAADYSNLFASLANTAANRLYGIPTSHQKATDLTSALIVSFAKRFHALGVTLMVAMLPYMGDHSVQSSADQEFVIRHLRAAGIPTLIPAFPRDSSGGLDMREFMVSKIDQHPNRRYNVTLSTEIMRFLQAEFIGKPSFRAMRGPAFPAVGLSPSL